MRPATTITSHLEEASGGDPDAMNHLWAAVVEEVHDMLALIAAWGAGP